LEETTEREPPDADWANRRLCVDESCIGTIGSDGRCRECGRLAGPASHLELEVEESGVPAAEADAPQEAEGPQKEEERDEGDADWSDRRLCEDESCIGTIGRDGRCTECGRPAPR
jgi:hypothetical protein